MPISNHDLATVREMLPSGRPVPAIIVRGIVERLARLEGALCDPCRSRLISV